MWEEKAKEKEKNNDNGLKWRNIMQPVEKEMTTKAEETNQSQI